MQVLLMGLFGLFFLGIAKGFLWTFGSEEYRQAMRNEHRRGHTTMPRHW